MVMRNAIPTKSDSLYKEPTVKDFFPSNPKKTTGFKSFLKSASLFSLFSLACLLVLGMKQMIFRKLIHCVTQRYANNYYFLGICWKEFLDIDTSNISCVLLRSIDVSSFLRSFFFFCFLSEISILE